jgi:sigma-E factor negative regulatory protein RseB
MPNAFYTMRFLLTFVLCFVLNAQAADNDAANWQMLQKAAEAAHALSYQGIFVCQSGKQAQSVQIKHLYNGQQEFMRNVMLDGAPREIFSHSGDLVIYNPKNETVVIEKRHGQNLFPAVLPLNIDEIKTNYTLRTGSTERVADRTVQILLLDAKDGFRNNHQFWIDTEYGLVLKSIILNQNKEIIGNIGFNQINLFNTVDLDWYQPKIDAKKSYVMEESTTSNDNYFSPHWQLTALPAGYRKVDQMARMVQGKPLPVTHMIFSDGLASVSLFIEKLPKDVKPRTGASMVGNTSVYSRVSGFLQITAVGEVPEATTANIANAVIFVK